MRPQGNTKLVESGIQTEDSQIRAHVCAKIGRVYIFPTRSGVDATRNGNRRPKPAMTGEIVTAMGYLVSPSDIEGCQHVPIPERLLHEIPFDPKDSTSVKGQKATLVVRKMIEMGEFPIRFSVREVNERKMQLSGIDLTVEAESRIQVKMDFYGGHRELGGTGNLYLQVAECNPYRCY